LWTAESSPESIRKQLTKSRITYEICGGIDKIGIRCVHLDVRGHEKRIHNAATQRVAPQLAEPSIGQPVIMKRNSS